MSQLATLAALVGLATMFPHTGLADPTIHRVEIEKFAFVPERLELRPGDMVEWVNRDIAPHTATARDRSWNTEGLGKGRAAVITFSDPGIFAYFCRYHPNMRGAIAVIGD